MHTVGNYPIIGQMGFFGGITTGTRLPQTTERRIALEGTARRATGAVPPMPYREVVFLDGRPREFEGLLTVTPRHISDTSLLGTLTGEVYQVNLSNVAPPGDVEIARTISFDVNYRIEGNQVIRDYRVNNWTETILIDGIPHVLDPNLSSFVISVIEDRRAAVTYYRGDISMRAVYSVGEGFAVADERRVVTEDRWGSFYGFRSAWSGVETHRINSTITSRGPNAGDNWEQQIQLRPSASVAKSLQFAANEPTMISFAGNFREVMQTTAAMEWNVLHRPQQFSMFDDSGRVAIPTFNTFEQLIAPNLNFLRGHPAEFDAGRLFSMQVLDGDPRFFRPDQAMTRGQFTVALTRAMNLPLPAQQPARNRRNVPVLIFPDVPDTRPEFSYIMAARNVGLANGRENGHFHIDDPLDRQEAIALMVRALGLEDMGIYPVAVTPFADDRLVANWARRELYVAERIGLISGDDNGNIRPRDMLTQAEGAAIINRFIEYMRYDLAMDYAEHIVNYAN